MHYKREARQKLHAIDLDARRSLLIAPVLSRRILIEQEAMASYILTLIYFGVCAQIMLAETDTLDAMAGGSLPRKGVVS
jgi:hypothetical protein